MTFAVLGNKKGVIHPWYLPKNYCLCLVAHKGKAVTTIARNTTTADIPGLPVKLVGRDILGAYQMELFK